MLKRLHIENYALIREMDLELHGGFVAITGETGAGKSILLGALSLLLGLRADLQVLRDKEKKCVVEAEWEVDGLGLEPLFEENDLDYDDQLLLRREIAPSGRSRAFANDTPVQLAFLKTLGEHLIDIHSQHQTLSLTDRHFQLDLLDQLSDDRSVLESYKARYREYAVLKRELEHLMERDRSMKQDMDYRQFQLGELEEARLDADEQSALEQEQELQNHLEGIKEAFQTVDQSCQAENGAMDLLRQSRSALSRVTPFCQEAQPLYERLDSVVIETDDILRELDRINQRLSFSPERLQQVNDRLDLIYRLLQKHGLQDESQLVTLRDQLREELSAAASSDEQIREVMEAVDKAFEKVQKAASALSAQREAAAHRLEQQILPTLGMVGMKNARLVAEVRPTAEYTPTGHDEAVFLFNANKGGGMRELSKVASGGELSRLMLAVKSLVTTRSLLPTIIFDEIDTGISGDISVAVGSIMQAMSQHLQVVAITHMPQIAAKAGQHLKVYKEDLDDTTASRIRDLAFEERVREVAVMLSSDPPTPAALQTAKELLQ